MRTKIVKRDNTDNIPLPLRDIANLKTAEKALNVFEHRYRRLFETSRDGILILDAETGMIVDVNPFLIEILGYTKSQFLKKKIWEIGLFKDIIANRDNFIELQQKKYIRYENLPLLTADGRQIEVEFISNVHLVNGKNVIQCNIRDNTNHRQLEKELLRDNDEHIMEVHDQLTGLYNRRFYEEELKRLDIEENLPISIVMCDVNGLKLVNDSFGHVMGDRLLQKVAEILKKVCRADEIIARLGGDEFIILLPKTDELQTGEIIKRINHIILKENAGSLAISISIGFETKNKINEDMRIIFKNTEDHMYRHKLSESSSARSKIVGLILKTLFEKSNREMLHSKRVSDICVEIAAGLNFDLDSINMMRTVGLMHDIGKIGIDEEILNTPKKLNPEERKEIERHCEIGYQILNSVSDFSEIAIYMLEHHERWDGKGYPRGRKGKEISLQARIVAVADAYDAMTSTRSYKETLNEAEAISELRRCSGTQFDPKIVNVFIEKALR